VAWVCPEPKARDNPRSPRKGRLWEPRPPGDPRRSPASELALSAAEGTPRLLTSSTPMSSRATRPSADGKARVMRGIKTCGADRREATSFRCVDALAPTPLRSFSCHAAHSPGQWRGFARSPGRLRAVRNAPSRATGNPRSPRKGRLWKCPVASVLQSRRPSVATRAHPRKPDSQWHRPARLWRASRLWLSATQ
jgi:hypothetical protein